MENAEPTRLDVHLEPPGLAACERSAALFERMRPALIRMAYRMLGSVADAEDVIQEAFLRWSACNRDEVREPEAFVRRIVVRLCLDEMKSARQWRETYIGPWLPEPMLEPEGETDTDVTLPLMLALERLSPLERAAFLPCSPPACSAASQVV